MLENFRENVLAGHAKCIVLVLNAHELTSGGDVGRSWYEVTSDLVRVLGHHCAGMLVDDANSCGLCEGDGKEESKAK